MVRAKRLLMLVASGIVAFGSSALGATPPPYPQGMDYGISEFLRQWPAACIEAPIDGGGASERPVYVMDAGRLNLPERQAAIDALEQLVEFGLLARAPSETPRHRDYRIVDTAAYQQRGTFCYGREVLTKIISITQPQTSGPLCVRYAEVLTEFRDVPDWMSLPVLAPYVENRAASNGVGRSRTIQLRRNGESWEASTPYDPVHSNWFGRRVYDACAPYR